MIEAKGLLLKRNTCLTEVTERVTKMASGHKSSGHTPDCIRVILPSGHTSGCIRVTHLNGFLRVSLSVLHQVHAKVRYAAEVCTNIKKWSIGHDKIRPAKNAWLEDA